MARVTNEQLKTAMDSIDTRLTNVESILMGRRTSDKNGLSPATVFLVKWVVFPLIVVVGSVVGVSINLPLGG